MTKSSSWIAQIQLALEELAAEYDPSVPEATFVFHPLYRVGVSENSYSSIEKIFGKSFLGRFRHYSGNLKKLDWAKYVFKRFIAKLPSDSIVFFRDDKEGVIIASHEKNFALKMFFNKAHISLLEEEIKTLKDFKTTSFSPYVAKLLGEGTTSNGGRWLVTSFCSNSLALTNRRDHVKYLLQHFPLIVMPPMTEFYRTFSPRIIPVNSWINEAFTRAEGHPSRNKIETLLRKISQEAVRFPGYAVIESKIHHDLHAGNILIDDNQTIIIDWEGQVRGLVLVDILDFSRRYLQKSIWAKFCFWLFMKGILKEPSSLVKKSLSFYRNWNLVNYEVRLADDSGRLSFMIYAVERALILFEKRKVDRFNDRNGFENKIFTWI